MISHGKDLKIFSGSSSKALANDICKELSIPLGNAETGAFSDGENFVSIYETVRGSDVFVVQSTCSPVNDNLMELLIMIDALKRASAGRITAVIPYFGYARQDRKTKPRDPISAKLVANLIARAGADRVLTMDLHANQIQGFFDIPVDNLLGSPVFVEHFFRRFAPVHEETMVVSPDVGSVARARAFAQNLVLLAVISAVRMPGARCTESMSVIPGFARLWRNRRWRNGVVAQFFYVGVQTGVWSFTIRLAMERLGVRESDASEVFLWSILAFTGFRFLFTWLMGYIRPSLLLCVASVGGVACTLGVIYGSGESSVWSLVGISACMSLMFPTIYGLALEGISGEDAKLAASGLIMAILGGALITPLQALVSDRAGIGDSFWIPAGCLMVVLAYALGTLKNNRQ